MHTSLGDLLNNYSDGLSAPSLSYASTSHHLWIEVCFSPWCEDVLEDEPGTEYEEVTMRHTHPMRVPVTMRVSQSHIRITTVSYLPIKRLLSLMCLADESAAHLECTVMQGHRDHPTGRYQ